MGMGLHSCGLRPQRSSAIKEYLKTVREEQAQTRVRPHKAVPLFEDKLVRIAKHILSKLTNHNTPLNLLYVLSRDLAFFCIDFYAGVRSSDLGRAKSREVLYLPDFSGLLFNHIFRKTLRDGSTHSFCVWTSRHSIVSPISSFKLYLDICRLIKVDTSSGFLFRCLTRHGAISEEPFIGSGILAI